LYKVKTFNYGVRGVHEYKDWLQEKGALIEIVSVNSTEDGLLFVTYKKGTMS
jgi:hypothetical protein